MSFGLSQETIEKIINLLKKYPEIEEVRIYGSRARGDYKRGSDIDLAFFASSNTHLSSRLSWELDDLATIYLFNVVDYHTLTNVALKKEIDKHGQVFYTKKSKQKEMAKNIKT